MYYCCCKKYSGFLKLLFLVLVLAGGSTACKTLGQVGKSPFPTVALELEGAWRLDAPVRRFDASGIERGPKGDLLVVRDAELAVYAVRFNASPSTARLVKHARYVVDPKKLTVGGSRFDVEGLAIDPQGILYACDERERRVLRFTARGKMDRVSLDFSQIQQYFSEHEVNASFEGIAIGPTSIFLANERSRGRLFEWDLRTGRLLHDFLSRTGTSVWPDAHYSGLDWHDGKLYALLREEQSVVEIDAQTREVLRVFRYNAIEFDPQHRYRTAVPFVGVMEGILVEGDVVWLVADNNGEGRYANRADRRPSLFKCRIPKKG